jgi:pyridoxal 5'-phosphate synthase pdxS subunit
MGEIKELQEKWSFLKGARKKFMFKKKAESLRVPVELVEWVAIHGKLPVVNFAAGGIATPADAAMMMQLGCDGIFVGSGIFKSSNPRARAKAIVEATLHYNDPAVLAKCSEGLGEAMESLEMDKLDQKYAERGW